MRAALVYLYAVADADAARWAERERPRGVEGSEVRAIVEGDVAAVVSEVAADAFEQDALDQNVRDPKWLTPRATSHQEVNAAAHVAVDAVLPVPFGTIYRSEARVREMLRDRAEELRAKLEGVRGRAEWVVGLYRDTAQAAEHLSRVSEALEHRETVGTGPGRRYLEQHRDEGTRRAELRRLDDEAATAAHHAVERVSKRAFEEPVIEEVGDLVARTTYLARRADEARLKGAVEGFNADWRERGYELRVTGPWPPYRSSGVAS